MQTNAMVFKSVLAVIMMTCCLAGIEAQGNAVAREQDLKITSRTDDYAIQKQRQYAANIVSMTEQLATYKKNFENQLLTMETQKALLVANIKETEEHLQPLELLSDLSKHCVQLHYRQTDVATVATVASVNVGINNCVKYARDLFPNIVSAAQTTTNSLNKYYNEQLAAALAECKAAHVNAQLNYTICVTKTINSAESVTIANLKQFKNQMETVTCTGDGHVKQAVDCAYNIIRVALSKMAEVSRLVEDCVQGKHICPPCPLIPPPFPASECPKEIHLRLTEAELQNATISNPFVGVNTDCLTVKFIDPKLQ